MSTALLVLVVVLALVLAYYNGFHDASNAVSTAITTRTLKASTALVMAAVLNLLGALLSLLLITLTADWALRLLNLSGLAASAGPSNLLGVTLVAIILATLGWSVFTWWMGMPSSTWHAAFGSVFGATLAIGAGASWDRMAALLLAAALVGPVLGAVLSYLLMRAVLALGRSERLQIGHLRFAQTVSAGAVATGHGMNDARLPMALIVVATASAGTTGEGAAWYLLPVAAAVAIGTLAGGHRIIRTIGRRLTDLSAAQGLAAESSAAIVMGAAMLGLDNPISTSHTLASSVVGAGAAMGPRHVRWPVAGTMFLIWLLTPLVTALAAAAMTALLAGML